MNTLHTNNYENNEFIINVIIILSCTKSYIIICVFTCSLNVITFIKIGEAVLELLNANRQMKKYILKI